MMQFFNSAVRYIECFIFIDICRSYHLTGPADDIILSLSDVTSQLNFCKNLGMQYLYEFILKYLRSTRAYLQRAYEFERKLYGK